MVVAAQRMVPVGERALFEHLADLDRHRLLTDRGMRILRLHGPPGRRSGGVVELRGPLGLRRYARTHVRGAEYPRELWGTADTPGGSRAALRWPCSPPPPAPPSGSRSTSPSGIDRLLLACGGRTWLRRRQRAGLRRLERSTIPA